ncbi:MAG: ATP-binding protein [Candidatus Eisenbacteria bacterium]
MRELELSSELRHLKRVRGWVQKACREAGLSDEAVSDMRLVVGEAFTNCVEHGYGYDPHGRVRLTGDVEGDQFVIRVSDKGESFELEDRGDPDLTEAHEGGYGLYLMKQLTDRFEVCAAERRGTTVILAKRIDSPPHRPSGDGEGDGSAGMGRVAKELFGDIR